jgi:hypothetical protein
VGSYTDARGNRLTINDEPGGPVSARIDWSAGMVTRAYLVGDDSEKGVAFFEWSSTTPLLIEGDGAAVAAVSMHGARFSRD